MKIRFIKGDTGGCGFYRCDEPARVLRELGHEVHVSTQLPVEGYVPRSGELKLTKVLDDQDIMIVQRPISKTVAYAFELGARQGVPMLIDLDDDLERIDRANKAFYAVDPRTSPGANWEWLRRSCKFARGMLVSTPALQRYMPSRSVVVRNAIPDWVFDLPPAEPRAVPRLGWTGTIATHPKDLHQVSGVIQQVLDATGAALHVIGTGEGTQQALGLRQEPTVTEWLDSVEDYLRALTALDVGIVPLERSAFNDAKSGLKAMELAAAGVPCVASATPEYRLLAADGGCTVADKPVKWIRQLTPLLSDPVYRTEQASKMRQAVKNRHAISNRAEEWEKAIASFL